MKKIISLVMVISISAMMAATSMAEEESTAPAEATVVVEEAATNSNIMYNKGEAYVGVALPNSKQVNSNGVRVIGDSGISVGIKGGYFVIDNLDVSLSYIFGTWKAGTQSAGTNELHLMANYHYPFANFSGITIGGLVGLGYNSYTFQPPTAAGTALSGGGFVYEAGFDARMSNFEYFIVYRMGSIAYSTANATLTLNCIESGFNYVFDTSSFSFGGGGGGEESSDTTEETSAETPKE